MKLAKAPLAIASETSCKLVSLVVNNQRVVSLQKAKQRPNLIVKQLNQGSKFTNQVSKPGLPCYHLASEITLWLFTTSFSSKSFYEAWSLPFDSETTFEVVLLLVLIVGIPPFKVAI